VIVFHSPLLQDGQGGRCFVEPTSMRLPQFVHSYVPALTSLPAGTGSAIVILLVADYFRNPARDGETPLRDQEPSLGASVPE
jgi:hypothetical protein